MLNLMKEQTLSVLKSIVLQCKQSRSVDGFLDGRDAKRLYALALRGFQDFGTLSSSHDMVRVVCSVLEQITDNP